MTGFAWSSPAPGLGAPAAGRVQARARKISITSRFNDGFILKPPSTVDDYLKYSIFFIYILRGFSADGPKLAVRV
jgi:hypothetical protein